MTLRSVSWCVGVALSLAAAALPAAAQSIDTMALRQHTSVLAHDSMRGRRTGTQGGEAAVRYIAGQLAALGLQPLAQSSFLQPVPLREVIVHDSTALEVRTAGETRRFEVDRDFVVSTGGRNALRSASGAALFVGTSASALRLEASDELRDRVLIVLGPLGDDAGTLSRAWMRAGVRGAVLLIPDARAFTALAHSVSERRFQVDAPVDEPVWQPDLPIVVAGPAIAAALLAGVQFPAGAAPDSLARPIDLLRTVTWTLHATTRAISTHNVAGMLRGTDPALREEVVIFTAHWDHLGVRDAVAGDSIYNGFSDNAAGVAMLLAIAQSWRASPSARSVAFLFTAAEEEGLLGSAYYAAAPLLPLARTVAVINLDAGAPPVPPVSWRFAGDPTSALSEIAGEITRSHGWTPELGPARPNSDHWPFLARRVPAVFIVPGNKWEGVSDEERNRLRQRWDRYHQASDHWAADFPFAGLQRYAALALEIGKRVASSGARQH